MSGLCILIVEDEAIIAMLLSQVVEGMGHRVCDTVATETEAVAAAARCKPDLMIVDAHLREGSGIAAVTEILRNGFVPHVFVSGDMATARGLGEGAVVLEKPFDESELAHAMERALERAVAPSRSLR